MNDTSFTTRAHAAIALAVGMWCALFIAAPLLGTRFPEIASVLYALFSQICHQMDSRSFHLAGHKLGVCFRCTAIYSSFFLTILFIPFFKKVSSRVVSSILLFSLLPMVVDVAADTLGLHTSSTVSRLLTGSIAGAGLAVTLLPLLLEALNTIRAHQEQTRNKRGAMYAAKTR